MSISIPVDNFAIDQPIIDAIKKINPEFKTIGWIRDPKPSFAPLNRLYDNLVTIVDKNSLDFPPVIANAIGRKNGKTYYSIVDGRHRLAISIGLNLPTINAIVRP